MKQDKGLIAKDTVMGLDAFNIWSKAWHLDNDVSELYMKAGFLSRWEVAKLQHQAEITWDKAKARYEPLITKALKDGVDKTHKACDETYGEMLKAERERIFRELEVWKVFEGNVELEKYGGAGVASVVAIDKDFWQALKGGN